MMGFMIGGDWGLYWDVLPEMIYLYGLQRRRYAEAEAAGDEEGFG